MTVHQSIGSLLGGGVCLTDQTSLPLPPKEAAALLMQIAALSQEGPGLFSATFREFAKQALRSGCDFATCLF